MRLSASVFLAALCALTSCQDSAYAPWPREMVPGAVRHYSCRKLAVSLKPDEVLDDAAWKIAPWSEPFLDIEGSRKPEPRHATWMKMLWDNNYLYVAAYLQDPDLWATMDKRDMVVFHENDFEVFIDPEYQNFKGSQANTQSYYELEFNVIETIFDLYLSREYRLGGIAHPEWNCEGIQVHTKKYGTANNSTDTDTGWMIEIRIPFKCLRPPATVAGDTAENIRAGDSPEVGDKWRMNFSRVQWQLEKVGAGYVKKPGTKEDNWVWTPQWAVDMHRLEHWGVVKFTDS